MRFPQAVEVFGGRAFSTEVVLVVIPREMGAFARGSVFLSTDGGETYQELYFGGQAGTRQMCLLTLVVPDGGDDVYIVNANRDGATVAFATREGTSLNSHLLGLRSDLPRTDYVIEELTDGHMAKIEALR